MNLKKPSISRLALISSSLLLAVVAVPPIASADDAAIHAVQATPASAICLPMLELQKYSVDEAGFIVNNFSVREAKDTLSGMVQMETTYSIANRSSEPVRVSGDFVFLDSENRILAAMSAGPHEAWVDLATTTKGSGQTFVNAGTVATVTTVCLRLFGTFPDK